MSVSSEQGTARVGIVGFGRIGAEHAGWIAAAGLAVSAVYDPTEARRDVARARGWPVTESLRALLDRCDTVLVATPTSFHFEHTMTCLAAGKHTMVEKPMALTHAQAKEMAEAARSANRLLCVFQCRRWDPDFLAVRELLAAGTLGRVFNIESRLGQWSSCVGPAAREWRPNWRNEAAFGGGGLYDWGSHFVDQIHLLLHPAKPVRVFAQLQANVWSQDCDDFARLLIDFDNGSSALVEINTTTKKPLCRWHLDGTNGSADSPYSLEFDTKKWAQLSVDLAQPTTAPSPATPPTPTLPRFDRLTEPQIWHRFAAACVKNDPAALPIDLDSVLLTLKLLDAARKSAATGQTVAIE